MGFDDRKALTEELGAPACCPDTRSKSRIDPGRACELHRLTTNLLRSAGVPHSGTEASK